jgi:hypothetical protein
MKIGFVFANGIDNNIRYDLTSLSSYYIVPKEVSGDDFLSVLKHGVPRRFFMDSASLRDNYSFGRRMTNASLPVMTAYKGKYTVGQAQRSLFQKGNKKPRENIL